MNAKLDELEKYIGYSFQNKDLLTQALTHPSFNEHDQSKPDNQRMEFLGDSILSAILSEALYIAFPEEDEGSLSRKRAVFIRGSSLAKIANELRVDNFLLMSVAELKNSGNQRSSTLEDATEAIIGAIFLDGGIGEAKKCILNWFGDLPVSLFKSNIATTPKDNYRNSFTKNQYRIKFNIGYQKKKDHPIRNILKLILLSEKKLLVQESEALKKKQKRKQQNKH